MIPLILVDSEVA